MFSIQAFEQSGFEMIALTDQASGTQVEIIPAYGGLLHAFRFPHKEGLLNIIDNYSSPEDYQHNMPEYFKGAKLSPFACRIPGGHYRWGQQEYTIQTALSPGKVMHGLLYNKHFVVTTEQADEYGAVLTLLYQYHGEDAGYPFPYDCAVQYHLLPEQKLSITTVITNHAATAIPFMDGWHPYFTTGTPLDEMELQFASSQIVEFNAQLVPTGQLLPYRNFEQPVRLQGVTLDNSFLLDLSHEGPSCSLLDPVKRVAIHFFPDAGYPVLQVYIPQHRKSIAIENLTGAPNAFNNGIGLVTLQAGESRQFTTTIAAGIY